MGWPEMIRASCTPKAFLYWTGFQLKGGIILSPTWEYWSYPQITKLIIPCSLLPYFWPRDCWAMSVWECKCLPSVSFRVHLFSHDLCHDYLSSVWLTGWPYWHTYIKRNTSSIMQNGIKWELEKQRNNLN